MMWVNFSAWQRIRRFCLLLAGTGCLVDTLVLLASFKVNAGTLLPGGVGLLLLFPLVAPRVFGRCLQHLPFRLCWWGGWSFGLLLLIGLPIFVVLAHFTPGPPPATQPAAAIILGAGLRDGNQPSPLLANRLNTALTVLRNAPDMPVIVSGGRGMLEDISEAQAMQRFLTEHGIASQRIWLEAASTSTEENLRFSRRLLAEHGIEAGQQPVTIITSDFHLYRSARLARHAGYTTPAMIPAPTPLSILPNVWLREYLACLKAWAKGEI